MTYQYLLLVWQGIIFCDNPKRPKSYRVHLLESHQAYHIHYVSQFFGFLPLKALSSTGNRDLALQPPVYEDQEFGTVMAVARETSRCGRGTMARFFTDIRKQSPEWVCDRILMLKSHQTYQQSSQKSSSVCSYSQSILHPPPRERFRESAQDRWPNHTPLQARHEAKP